MAKFLEVVKARATPVAKASGMPMASLERVATALASSLDEDQIKKFAEYRKVNKGVPSEFDGRLIAKARDEIGRDLDQVEKRKVRAYFVDAVRKRKPALFT